MDTKALCDAFRFLRNAAPEEYDNMLKQFKKYTDDQVLATAMADQVNVLGAQGRARQCLALLRFITETDEPAPR